jgi:molybdate transport system substrate-binding protein
MLRTCVLVLVLAMGLAWPRWAAPQSPAAPRPKAVITVLAAASTTEAIDEIRKAFAAAGGGEVQASFASSATLAQQIVHGAEADVFVSADEKWADYLAEKGFVAQRASLLQNRLVLVVPLDGTRLTRLADLADPRIAHVAMGDPQGVPAGKYARQALVKLGLWDRLREKVVAAEDVRQALIYVETGAAEAGFVYSTDAAASRKVRVAVEVPETLTGPIRYAVVLLRHGGAAGREFYRYLQAPAAAKVFEKHGFRVTPAAAGK